MKSAGGGGNSNEEFASHAKGKSYVHLPCHVFTVWMNGHLLTLKFIELLSDCSFVFWAEPSPRLVCLAVVIFTLYNFCIVSKRSEGEGVNLVTYSGLS